MNKDKNKEIVSSSIKDIIEDIKDTSDVPTKNNTFQSLDKLNELVKENKAQEIKIEEIKPSEIIPIKIDPTKESEATIIKQTLTEELSAHNKKKKQLLDALLMCLEFLKPIAGSEFDTNQTNYIAALRIKSKIEGAIHHSNYL